MNTGDKNCSRRNFLSKSIAGIAAGSLLGSLAGSALSYPSEEKKPGQKKEILYRTLGKTGIKVPIVSMGVMNASMPELVRHSYEIGIRHFDTAAYYQGGKNERMIGDVLKQLGARGEVTIATKVYIPEEQRSMPAAKARDFYLKTAGESLGRLQTDYVDVLYIHNASALDDLRNPGVLEALQTLKKEGKARFIGFSTHANMVDVINEAAKSDFWDVILTTFNFAFHGWEALTQALKSASDKKIGLIAMKTQSSQDWYIRDLPPQIQNYYRDPIVQTAVLKWVLRHPFIATAVPGTTTFQQIEEDFAVAYDLDYNEKERKFLSDRDVDLSLGCCRQCGECVGQCGKVTDIPTLMRVHMYSVCYNNFSHARQTLDDIPAHRSIENCASCDECSAHCEHGVNIGSRIRELQTMYG
jgi:predicted aldo/keto reductase-like oxidoreductase